MEVKIEGETLEQGTEFVFLGGLINKDGRCTKGKKRKIGLVSEMIGIMNNIRRLNNIRTATKVKIYGTFVKIISTAST